VEQGLINGTELRQALRVQQELANKGERVLIGRLLVSLGCISGGSLSTAVTKHIKQLQSALERSNRGLERRAQQRTA
jgi:hypothetical protein